MTVKSWQRAARTGVTPRVLGSARLWNEGLLKLEFVRGWPLHEIPEGQPVPTPADVKAALRKLHELGIVHNDVFPGNILSTPRGKVRVVDLDIATVPEEELHKMQQMQHALHQGAAAQ